MTDFTCPFCGSKELILKTPYVEMTGWKQYENKTTYCCNAQAKNQKYIKERYDPTRTGNPKTEDISKW